MQREQMSPGDGALSGLGRSVDTNDGLPLDGEYVVECRDKDGNLRWSDTIKNVVCTEGKNALLTHALKGSSYTSVLYMGLIESTGYGYAGANGSGVAATNLASAITAVGGASPANGWNEATSSMCAARGTPTFGSASGGSISLSSAQSFSILAAATIKGCFILMKSAGAVSPTSTVGNTSGALLSAGLFTNGDKVVSSGDTLSVSYTLNAN